MITKGIVLAGGIGTRLCANHIARACEHTHGPQ